MLNDVTSILVKDPSGWRLKEEGDFEKTELALAIGKAIALKYVFEIIYQLLTIRFFPFPPVTNAQAKQLFHRIVQLFFR